jgi:hypothetical protein
MVRPAHHPEQSRRAISKFEFSNYLNKVWILVIWNSDLFRVSIFEFRILIYSLEKQKHSLDYVRNFWDTTLALVLCISGFTKISIRLDSAQMF